MDRRSRYERSATPADLDAIRTAASLIRTARMGLAVTGAGISTPSGIPDFRSPERGLWQLVDPLEVASLSAFRYNPEKFYSWIRPLARQILQAKPNPAHVALARLEQSGHLKTIITQNIDGLHQRAGSSHVLEVHGSIESLTCVGCLMQVEMDQVIEPFLATGAVPHCPDCGRVLKPDVILFEEQLPIRTWLKAEQAASFCDLMIVAGCSLEVMPAAGLPLRALERQASVIVINYTPAYIDSRADVVIHGDVAVMLPLIVEEVLRG